MTRSARLTLAACFAALGLAAGVGADSDAADSIPDPAQAWQLRDFSPVEAWLASTTNDAGKGDHSDDHRPVPVLRAQAWLARREGSAERALALIDRAIELAPDRPDLRVDRAAFRSDRIEDSGAFKSLRIARDVRRDLEHALAVAPEHPDALAALAAFHLRAPGIAGGDKQAAAALLERLGEIAPSRRLFREAAESARQERFEEAVDRIAEAIAAAEQPGPDWRILKGDWLHRLGRDAAALEAYRRALLEAPQHSGAMYALGRTAAESGLEHNAGIDALQRFLALSPWPQDPEPQRAWWQLGRIHAHAGCAGQAETAFRRALELDPGWREPRRSLDRLGQDANPDGPCASMAEQPQAQGLQ